MNPGGNGGPGDQDSSMKISANFIHVYPLKKPNFSSVWHSSFSRWNRDNLERPDQQSAIAANKLYHSAHSHNHRQNPPPPFNNRSDRPYR